MESPKSLYAVKRKMYERLPALLKLPFGWLPFSVLAGKSYRTSLAREKFIDRASREELLDYRNKRLGEMLDYATRQVEAYKPMRRAVETLEPHEALKEFPLLDKETLQRDFEKYLPRDIDKIMHYECSTGGTSGNQLKFYLDDSSQAIEMAFMHRQWQRIGYNHRCRKATFRGIEFKNLGDGTYWQPNPIYNELQFSPYHMNEQSLDLYLEKLIEYDPEFIHGYPSAVSILADYITRNNADIGSLQIKGVLLGSEGLDRMQREVIEKAFNTRAFSWYGHSERLILAGECEHTNAYHQFPDYGVLEIVDEKGEVLEQAGESGEVVGTGLINRSLPLIRYRTGDRARKLDHNCECHRKFDRFDQVEGRWDQEYIIGRNLSRISLAALNTHGPFFDNVVRYQYYQNKPGIMTLRLMVAPGFAEKDEKMIVEAFERKTGDELDIKVLVVEEIPLTERGKLKRLVQDIPNKNGKSQD